MPNEHYLRWLAPITPSSILALFDIRILANHCMAFSAESENVEKSSQALTMTPVRPLPP